MIENEDSRGLKRLYRWINFVTLSLDILYGSKHPQGHKNGDLCTRTHSQVPRAWSMRPEHALGSPSISACGTK